MGDTRMSVPGTILPDELGGQYQCSLGSALERMKYLSVVISQPQNILLNHSRVPIDFIPGILPGNDTQYATISIVQQRKEDFS